MKKRILPLLIAAVIFCLTLTACSSEKATDGNATNDEITSSSASTDESSEENDYGIFGDFETVDVDGNKADYTALQGKKLTMVNVWATFCGPCIREMPDLQKISKEYADKGFQIVGIVCDVTENPDGTYDEATLSEAKKVIESSTVSYLNLLMSSSLVDSEAGLVYSVPTTYFVDENGNQVGKSYVGSRSYEEWCGIIDGLLAE